MYIYYAFTYNMHKSLFRHIQCLVLVYVNVLYFYFIILIDLYFLTFYKIFSCNNYFNQFN